MLTVTPLLTATLSLESNPLADQLTLTWAAWADGLHGETCCHEFCFGGGGEVHRCAVCCENCRRWGRCLSIEQQRGDCLDACLVSSNAHPCHGVALGRAFPDDSILTHGSGKTVGVCHIGCPLTPPLVKGAECFGLDGDGVGHVVCLCCVYPSRSAGDLLPDEGHCLTCHNPQGADRFPCHIQHESDEGDLKHGAAMVGWGTGFGEEIDHNSAIISFISSASMFTLSHSTPSPV